MKALKINLYQPFAHYRHPKVMHDSYINTLNIPSPTTVIGMLSYVSGIRFQQEIDVGIISKHNTKEDHFIRGESSEFWEDYNKKIKNNKELGLNYIEYKDRINRNRIMTYEVLHDVEHTIFVKAEEDILEKLKESLNSPKRYISLGRKEDFCILGKKVENKDKKKKILRWLTEIVDLKEIYIESTIESIRDNLKLDNTYVTVNIQNENDEVLLSSGNLIAIPKKYKDITATKKDRIFEFGHYIELNDNKYFPRKRKVNIYEEENIAFTWLVGEVE